MSNFIKNELIPVKENDTGEVIVSGRELHEFLGIKTRYNDWFERMKSYGFIENTDFVTLTQKRVTAQNNETTYSDHAIKLDMAKEIAMIQRNEKGKQARQYFIQVEKAWNSPEMIMKRALEIANRNVEKLKLENAEKDKQLVEQKPKVDFAEHVATSNNSMLVREVAKIACKNGIKIGEHRLYEKLRQWGLIFKNSCEATQKAIEQGLFEVVEGVRESSKGKFTYKTTKVTGKGQVYIVNRLKKEIGPS